METLKTKNLSFPAKQFFKTLATLGLLLSLTACPGGGNSGAIPVTPLDPYGGNCGTCVTAIANPLTITVFQATNGDGNVELTNMQMVGDQAYLIPNASGNNFRNYQGPIVLQGQLVVRSPIQDLMSGCALPAGTYMVQTYEVGSMGYAGGDITVPRLMTTSGSVELVIAGGILTNYGARMTANIAITRVGGAQCSPGFFEMFY
jgi:hypothetical protein